MHRLMALCLGLLAVAGIACGGVAQGSAAARSGASRPNIILILTDDMGCGDLSCYGGSQGEAPHVDQLAREGIRFLQYYAASPICSAYRVALTTGMHPARWRITSYLHSRAGNREHELADWLDPRAPSLARTLRASGFATAHFGKWHMGGSHLGDLHRG